jgi:hypothetical protein
MCLFKRTRTPNTTIITAETADFQHIREHKDFIEKYPCPNCNELHLRLVKHLQGKKGWETQIICDHCKSTGVMNTEGVEFNLSGVPEKEVKK